MQQGRIEDLPQRTVSRLRVAAKTKELPSARVQYRRLYRWIAVTDTLAIAAALLLAYWTRFGVKVPQKDFVLLLGGTPFVMIGVFAAFGLYESHRFTPAEEFRRIILAVSLGLTGLVTLSFWAQAEFSRVWLGLSWGIALVLALGTRRIWHWRIGRARMSGQLAFPTIIVGANDEAHHLEDVMQRPNLGLRPIGLVSTGTWEGRHNGLPVLGHVRDLRDIIRETGAECVFVAATSLSPSEMSHVAKAVRLESVEVRVTASLPEVLSTRLSVQPFGGMMTLALKPARLSGTQAAAKRAFDLSVAVIGLTVSIPLQAAIAVAIRLSSPGPVLFRQRRVGHRGRPFTMLKFRTMQAGADGMVGELRASHGVDDLMFKLREDPRVTPVGRWLRRFSLDELPQLLNVLRGDMSLVGPRPPLPEEVTHYEDWQFDRLEVPPGITGLWQVSGRSDLSFEECVRLDLFYIENWSLAYDLYIIAKTMPVLMSRRGAY